MCLSTSVCCCCKLVTLVHHGQEAAGYHGLWHDDRFTTFTCYTYLSVDQQAGWQLHSAEAGLATEAAAEGSAVQGEAGLAGGGHCHASWDHEGALLLAPGLAPALAWGAQPIKQ